MERVFRHFLIGLAMMGAAFAIADPPVDAAASRAAQRRSARLDSKLRAVVDAGASQSQRVIIRVRPGSRSDVRKDLAAHGDQILGEHDSIDALSAVVHGNDLAELAENDAILSVSADAVVRPTGLLGGLLGGLLKTVLGLVGTVANVILPNGANTEGPVALPAVLRQTLGVDTTSLNGRGVGVAVGD
jgi:hypothetical protein